MAEERITVRVDEKGAAVVKRNIADIGKAAGGTHGMVGKLTKALGGLGIALGATAVIRNTINLWRSFGQTMSTVHGVSNATAEQFERMRDRAKELGATTRFTATQAGEGMLFLARAGLNAEENIAAVGHTLKLAQAGALDLGTAADIASNVLMGFRGDVSQLERVVDVLALAANSSNTNVQQLGQAMKFAAPVAAGLGVSVEEAAAAIGTLSDAGMQASMAGTGLRNIMAKLEAPTGAAKKILDSLNVSTEDVRVSQVGLTEAMKALVNAGMSTGQAMEFFGMRAGPAFEILSSAIPELEMFNERLQGAEGTADRVATIMDQNLNGALLATQSAIEAVGIAFGELGAEESLTKLMFSLAEAIRGVANNLETTIRSILLFAGAIAAIKYASFLASLATHVRVMSEVHRITVMTNLATMGTVKANIAAMGSYVSLNKVLALTRAAVLAVNKALLTNPITAGLVVLAVGIGTLTAAFDKMKKMQEEIDAVEERIHRHRLKRLQDQVKEINQRKENTKNLEAYMERLQRENDLLAMTNKEREEDISIAEALEIAKRALTETEEKRVLALLEERDAIRERNKVLEVEEQLYQSIVGPANEYAEQQKLLLSLRDKGRITQEQYLRTLAEMKQAYGDAGGGEFEAYLEKLREETRLMKASNYEKQVAAAIAGAGGDLKPDDRAKVEAALAERRQVSQEIYLDQLRREKDLLGMNNNEREIAQAIDAARQQHGEDAEYEQKLATQIRANQLTREQATLMQEIIGPQAEINRQIEALHHMMADPTLAEYHDLFLAKQEELRAMLEEKVVPAFTTLHEAGQIAFGALNNELDNFVDTGVFKIRDMVSDMLREFIRLMQQKLLLKAAMSLGIPGFQHGGSFNVGGSGGPDSQFVGFMATPGERVDVSTQAQQQNGNGAAAAPIVVPPAQVRVVNVSNPNEVTEVMSGAGGEQVIMNMITKNRASIRQVLS